MSEDITDWLRRLSNRRTAAFGAKGLDGCRYDEAANEIDRLRGALRKIASCQVAEPIGFAADVVFRQRSI